MVMKGRIARARRLRSAARRGSLHAPGQRRQPGLRFAAPFPPRLSAPDAPRHSPAMLRPRAVRCALLLLLALAPAAQAAGLSPLERKLAASVDRRLPQSLALLERAVNQNSGTLNLPGVHAVGELFAGEFDRLGFTTRWVDGKAWGRAGHLI